MISVIEIYVEKYTEEAFKQPALFLCSYKTLI